jgi:hypothetical protein
MRGKPFLRLAAFASFVCLSCNLPKPNIEVVTIWTDQSITALYAGYFNAIQDVYKAEVFYYENVSEYLAETKPRKQDAPDVIIGNWLNSAAVISLFKPVERYYKKDAPLEEVFYPGLLESGQVKNKQVVLPVSFDLYALAFDRNNAALLPDPFSLPLAAIRQIGADYNLPQSGTQSAQSAQNGAWTRIGFSPLWDEEFLFLHTALYGARWSEGQPVSWDDEKLKAALRTMREWVAAANGSLEADDDFFFKYFYVPPEKLAADDRILFTFTRISDFFKLAQERRDTVDFRWIEHENRIIPAENVVYYGIYRDAKAAAAGAFTSWFFHEDTQRLFLLKNETAGTTETFFGIMNGFSAMRGVTGTVFPQYYPEMLGHAPPLEKVVSPGVLPPFFSELKEQVILPYLREEIRSNDTVPVRPLALRLADWIRTG